MGGGVDHFTHTITGWSLKLLNDIVMYLFFTSLWLYTWPFAF